MLEKSKNIQWETFLRIKIIKANSFNGNLTTCYNQGMQMSTSKCTAPWTLKSMGYSSRRLHQVSQFALILELETKTTVHTGLSTWTIKSWRNTNWSDKSWFLLRDLVGSQVYINNVKAWIHPPFNQQFRLLVVMCWCGGYFLCILWVHNTNWHH